MPKLGFFLTDAAREAGIIFDSPRLGDAGFDLRAAEPIIILPGKQIAVATGLYLAIPEGWVGIIKDRSSMALKRVYTHAGVVDASYRGEVKILLSNGGTETYHIEPNDKVAQLVVVSHLMESEAAETLEELGTTNRGAGGFGSTGR